MTKSTLLSAGLVLLILGLVAGLVLIGITFAERPPPAAREVSPVPAAARPAAAASPAARTRPAAPPERGRTLSAQEKAARIEKIKRDYDEIRTKASAEYSASGSAFPGGLNAFLRQLALLEREKRADFASFLTTAELEDLEMRETGAGQLVQKLLGGTAATEEQRRAVFRLQRDFEDRFALTFDVTPPALLARETARQQTQERIRAVLGDALFGAWLAGEGDDHAKTAALAARLNLPAATPLELWRAKNDYFLRRLEIGANRSLSFEQKSAAAKLLTQQTEARVMNIIGPGAWHAARAEILGWLPQR